MPLNGRRGHCTAVKVDEGWRRGSANLSIETGASSLFHFFFFGGELLGVTDFIVFSSFLEGILG